MIDSKKTFFVDIDGTICNNTYGKYEEAIPIRSRIEDINKLYDQGHTIVYFTARGMNRFDGVLTMVMDKYYSFTYNQISNWGCKFHQLKLGKPSYDYIIDDKAVNDNDFFNYFVKNFKEIK